MDARQTLDRLKNFGNGATAHTANKCACYLEMAVKQEKTRLVGELVKRAQKAMDTGEWKELREYMSCWW